jgi:site-specific DNA-methyltransferase (adenine-specific)
MATRAPFRSGKATLYADDCFDWLRSRRRNSIHGVVTDPPYALVEYTRAEIERMETGRGVWRLPPAFDDYHRRPLPRFTELTPNQVEELYDYFHDWSTLLLRVLVPGAHVIVASTPLLEHMLVYALHEAGLEKRGRLVRLVSTFRGGDRPKYAHHEFPEVSVMARAMHEPWAIFRKPVESTVRENLRKWGTGGLRRPERERPFGDVIASSVARGREREIAPHPTLKPQAFLRQVVRAVLPLGTGVVLDPFAGSGSTLAAAEAVGYRSIGVEVADDYVRMACAAIPALAVLMPSVNGHANGHANRKHPTTSNEGRMAPRSAGSRRKASKT